MNRYTPQSAQQEIASSPATRPGFPYHKDLPANGDVTMILTLQARGDLELVPETDPHRSPSQVLLHPGSLLVLSGEARWRWLHRLRPVPDEKQRMSVVFGWRGPQAVHG